MIQHHSLLPLAACAAILFSVPTKAQVRMQRPRPINGDMLSNQNPLGPGSLYPCQGYVASQSRDATEQYMQGGDASIGLAGKLAAEGGGSCQISLSYDNGTSFRVLQSIIGGCTQKDDLEFKIPSSAFTGKALLAWTWFDQIGNREMHMNCAWIMIKTPSMELRHRRAVTEASDPNVIVEDPFGNPAHYPPALRLHSRDLNRRHGHTHRSLHQGRDTLDFYKLPYIFTANIPQTEYKTDHGCDVVFPDPGRIVKYGTSLASHSADDRTGFGPVSGCVSSSIDIFKRVASMPLPVYPNAATTNRATGTSTGVSTSATGSPVNSDAMTGIRATGTRTSTSPSDFPLNSNTTTTNRGTSTSTGTCSYPSISNATTTNRTTSTSTSFSTTSFPSISNATTTSYAVGTGINAPYVSSNSSVIQNSTMQSTLPLYPIQTLVSVIQSRTTTHTTTFTTRTSHSTLSTSTRAPQTITTSPWQLGDADACDDFGAWRCDRGGHRLSRCIYAADWVTNHEYTWADMGVPPGTRCVLDVGGEPRF